MTPTMAEAWDVSYLDVNTITCVLLRDSFYQILILYEVKHIGNSDNLSDYNLVRGETYLELSVSRDGS